MIHLQVGQHHKFKSQTLEQLQLPDNHVQVIPMLLIMDLELILLKTILNGRTHKFQQESESIPVQLHLFHQQEKKVSLKILP